MYTDEQIGVAVAALAESDCDCPEDDHLYSAGMPINCWPCVAKELCENGNVYLVDVQAAATDEIAVLRAQVKELCVACEEAVKAFSVVSEALPENNSEDFMVCGLMIANINTALAKARGEA